MVKIKVKEKVRKKFKDRAEKHPDWQEKKLELAEKIVIQLKLANEKLDEMLRISKKHWKWVKEVDD